MFCRILGRILNLNFKWVSCVPKMVYVLSNTVLKSEMLQASQDCFG